MLFKKSILLVVLGLLSLTAKADEYSCTVLLCLAHPAGYEQIAQCSGPIQVLRANLNSSQTKPVCDEAKPQADMTFVQEEAFDACPNGTNTLGSGTKALQMTPESYAIQSRILIGGSNVGTALNGTIAVEGIGDIVRSPDGVDQTAKKACVGDYIGQLNVQRVFEGRLTDEYVSAEVYERVVVLDASSRTWIATVSIDGQVSKVTALN